MTVEVTDGTIEFECYEIAEDGLPKTFESGNFRTYDDGAGYLNIECLEDCPHCGKEHWA